MAQPPCRLAKAVQAPDTGAALPPWRVKADLQLPVLLPGGSYRSVLVSAKGKGKTRTQLIEAASPRRGPGPGQGLSRRDRTYPRVVKRARHNSYPVRKPGDPGIRHDGPVTVKRSTSARSTTTWPPLSPHVILLGVLSGIDLGADHRRALKTVKNHAETLSRR